MQKHYCWTNNGDVLTSHIGSYRLTVATIGDTARLFVHRQESDDFNGPPSLLASATLAEAMAAAGAAGAQGTAAADIPLEAEL